MASAPGILSKYDRATLKITYIENPSHSSTLGNGHVARRAKYTGKVKRRFTFGFTEITNAEHKSLMDAFENTSGGADVMTDWPDPMSDDGDAITVQFAAGSNISSSYNGAGDVKTWHASGVVLDEV